MMDQGVARFSVSLNKGLLRQLDKMVREKGYDNRSLAIADMVRDQLVGHRLEPGDAEAAGTVTLVYDHHTTHVQETLTEIQHACGQMIISTVHVHLDHHNCLEVLVVRGRAAAIKSLADRLIGARGVKHGKLSITTTGKDLNV
jgi:CopG family nickel-responsive transcriptional regulator